MEKKKLSPRKDSEAIKDSTWKAYVDNGMKVANSKTTSSAQIVQKWKWLPCDFCEKVKHLKDRIIIFLLKIVLIIISF